MVCFNVEVVLQLLFPPSIMAFDPFMKKRDWKESEYMLDDLYQIMICVGIPSNLQLNWTE
jgi:hypothetical protein